MATENSARSLNLYKMHVKRQRRSLRREAEFQDGSSLLLAGQLVDQTISPSKHMIKKEQQVLVMRAVNRLSKGDREILLMRFVEGLSYADIGYSIDLSEAAARKRSSRALQRLRLELGKSAWGETSE